MYVPIELKNQLTNTQSNIKVPTLRNESKFIYGCAFFSEFILSCSQKTLLNVILINYLELFGNTSKDSLLRNDKYLKE